MVSQGVLSLLFPFQWPHTLIPILPAMLADYLSAPVPFLIGIQQGLVSQADIDEAEVMLFDLTNNEVRGPRRDFPVLPERQSKKLLEALSAKSSGLTSAGVAMRAAARERSGGGGGGGGAGGGSVRAGGMGAEWAVRGDPGTGTDSTMVTTRAEDELAASFMRAQSPAGPGARAAEDEGVRAEVEVVRSAFLRFFVSMFQTYRQFYLAKARPKTPLRASVCAARTRKCHSANPGSLSIAEARAL